MMQIRGYAVESEGLCSALRNTALHPPLAPAGSSGHGTGRVCDRPSPGGIGIGLNDSRSAKFGKFLRRQLQQPAIDILVRRTQFHGGLVELSGGAGKTDRQAHS